MAARGLRRGATPTTRLWPCASRRSFAASSASTLDALKRAGDARQAFLRELRSRPGRGTPTSSSASRNASTLSKARIRTRVDADEPDKLKTRLGALAAMSESLG